MSAQPRHKAARTRTARHRVNRKVQTNVRLPPELRSAVDRLAQANHVTVSDICRLTLYAMLPVIERGEFRLAGDQPGGPL